MKVVLIIYFSIFLLTAFAVSITLRKQFPEVKTSKCILAGTLTGFIWPGILLAEIVIFIKDVVNHFRGKKVEHNFITKEEAEKTLERL